MKNYSRTVGDDPRKRLELELREKQALHRKINCDYRPTLFAVLAMEKEFESYGQFHWLAAALGNQYEPLETTYDEKDALGSYARLIEDYINPTGVKCPWALQRDSIKRGAMVLPGGAADFPRAVLTVMGTHTGWMQARSERLQLTLSEAVAVINKQLDNHGDRLKVVRLVTFRDWVYGDATASKNGWLQDLTRRIACVGGMFQIVSWDRSGLAESPAEECHDRSASRWTHHICHRDTPARPHWRVDCWK